jgi:hypothetical protein
MEQENETDGSKFVHQWKFLAKRTGTALLSESGTPLKRHIGGFCQDGGGIVFDVKLEVGFELP